MAAEVYLWRLLLQGVHVGEPPNFFFGIDFPLTITTFRTPLTLFSLFFFQKWRTICLMVLLALILELLTRKYMFRCCSTFFHLVIL